jgi:SpoIID/LytB domain protein
MVLVDHLPLERYLLGLDEVPPDWPVEALRAQAVAARTYALWTLGQPPGGAAAVYGFDICASTDCQVFSGADVVGTLLGSRWRSAVEDTEGTAVLYDGEPILARYHSVSGGHTFSNEQIFTDEGPYPYLKGVPSRTEEGTPLANWTVTFPARRARVILEVAGYWTDEGRLRDVRVAGRGRASTGPHLLFVGSNGKVSVAADDFREAARDIAPARWPDEYPSAAPTGSGRLPETLPSNRVTVVMRKGRVIFRGRGWGHGVGMSQWGAEGLARRGATYDDILRHYYTGVSLGQVAPQRVSVGLDWARSEVTVSGAFKIVDGRGRDVVADALGTWTFRSGAPGSIKVDPPAGYGLPLRVGIVHVPDSVEPGDTFSVRAALSRPARVRLSVAPGGEPVSEIRERGVVSLATAAPEEPGEYSISLSARSGGARWADEAKLLVTSPPAETSEPTDGEGAGVPGGILLVGGTLALAFILRALAGTMKR